MARKIDTRIMGLKIAYYRKKRRMTQTELAEKVNISVRYLSKIECGQVTNCASFPVLNRISNALGIGIEQLLTTEIVD
ncbi:helix-turn-helix domain-containing protein [Megasphaera sp.]|jgi:transcriptional regulator with XRE-family HTH domain|uniref:helix-turn-helix domain-containing protein n=1 Tax=Megasphaera sp. TaxID=2023260 RepID=UPI002638697C|nr:helix-turn-helix transcriptional regulator [uncultured Megasphaera sp.]